MSKNSKDNYRQVSILSNISKIYERFIYDSIQLFFDFLLSKYQCGFRRVLTMAVHLVRYLLIHRKPPWCYPTLAFLYLPKFKGPFFHFSTFSGAEDLIPWFTDIKSFKTLISQKISLTLRYYNMILHLKTFSNIL